MNPIKEDSFGVVPLKQVGDVWMVFVILHKQGRHWGFPKGKRQGEEDAKASAVRELKEETNLDVVRFLQEAPLVESYLFSKRGKKVLKTVGTLRKNVKVLRNFGEINSIAELANNFRGKPILIDL